MNSTRSASSPPRVEPAGVVLLGVVVLLVLALCAPGCRRRTDAQEGSTPAGGEAERIVSFAPSLTEIAVDLGLGQRLVGASTFDNHPAVAELPRVGGMADPNLEVLVALEPDLVLTTPSVARVEDFVATAMPETRVLAQEINTLAELEAAYLAVAEAAGEPERGREHAAQLRAELAELTVDRAAGQRPAVLLVVYRDPGALTGLVAAGPGTFLDELLRRAGARNALPDDSPQWPTLGTESVLAVAPDAIVELVAEAPPEPALEVWQEALPELAAVRAQRVHRLAGDHLLLPGPRVVDTLRALREVVE